MRRGAQQISGGKGWFNGSQGSQTETDKHQSRRFIRQEVIWSQIPKENMGKKTKHLLNLRLWVTSELCTLSAKVGL